eukprot:Tamp_34679.p1 GENE.Tamp_34679~~Tamp_34679.p1  ORF type:complete len:118 (-),score=2.56 Tamp_34679:70-423(-)
MSDEASSRKNPRGDNRYGCPAPQPSAGAGPFPLSTTNCGATFMLDHGGPDHVTMSTTSCLFAFAAPRPPSDGAGIPSVSSLPKSFLPRARHNRAIRLAVADAIRSMDNASQAVSVVT